MRALFASLLSSAASLQVVMCLCTKVTAGICVCVLASMSISCANIIQSVLRFHEAVTDDGFQRSGLKRKLPHGLQDSTEDSVFKSMIP